MNVRKFCHLVLISAFGCALLLYPGAAAAQEGPAIGVILPLSGAHAAYGHMQKNSMEMAVGEVNSRGGLEGGPLELDIRDSGGRPRDARAVVDHFVRDKQYPLVLGGFSSRVAAALADKCEQRRIPFIVVTGSEDAITLQDYRYVFRMSPPRSEYPVAALDYCRTVPGVAGIVLVSERSLYGDAMAKRAPMVL